MRKIFILVAVLVFAACTYADAQMRLHGLQRGAHGAGDPLRTSHTGGAVSGGAASCQATAKQSYTSGSGDIWFGGGSDWIASSFVVSTGYTLCKAEAALYKDGTCTGNITAYIYTNTADAPGSLVAGATSTNTVSANMNSAPATYKSWDFSNIVLASGTYWLVLLVNPQCSGNDLSWPFGSSGSLDNYTSEDGSSWSAGASSSQDNFKLYAYE
jgi:hypothetical protein